MSLMPRDEDSYEPDDDLIEASSRIDRITSAGCAAGTLSSVSVHEGTLSASCPASRGISGSRSTKESTRSAAPAARVNELSRLLSAC